MRELPDFTSEEKYLIDCLKKDQSSLVSNSYMWTYLSCSIALAGFAIYQVNFAMLLVAFVLVIGFRIYEESLHAKWQPLWKSIVSKFETAIRGD